jgi:hypothetical protein
MNMEQLVEWKLVGDPEVLGENLQLFIFVRFRTSRRKMSDVCNVSESVKSCEEEKD